MIASIISWVGANWMGIAVAVLAIDKAIEKLFPNATILGKVDALLSQVTPKQ